MKIALVTEGDSEYAALPKIVPQLQKASGNVIMNPLKTTIQPDAEAGVVARQAKGAVDIAAVKGADLIVLVLDRETRKECPGKLAAAIEAALAKMCNASNVRVVFKDRAFENWLVSDMDALAKQPGRFEVTAARRKKVEPNKSDKVNGEKLLKEMAIGSDYNKVQDAKKICTHLDISKASLHSRSFRHLLHVLGCVSAQDCTR